MNAADIMSHPVVTVTPDDGIAEAGRLMLRHRVSGLPVIDRHGAVVGILTEGDLLRRTETGTAQRRPRWLEFWVTSGRLAADYVASHGRKVGEIMTAQVVSATPQTPVADIVALMEQHHVKRVPILEPDGRPVGIVSRANLVRALLHALADREPPVGNDDAIRERILAEIAKVPWGPRATVDVTVKGGIVDLYGTIIHGSERAALQVLAENVPGVQAVRDHVVWVDPLTGLVISPDDAPGSYR